VVENLSSKCEALNSIPSTTKNFKNLKIKKKKKKNFLKKAVLGVLLKWYVRHEDLNFKPQYCQKKIFFFKKLIGK
jgi:hypothetical protein